MRAPSASALGRPMENPMTVKRSRSWFSMVLTSSRVVACPAKSELM